MRQQPIVDEQTASNSASYTSLYPPWFCYTPQENPTSSHQAQWRAQKMVSQLPSLPLRSACFRKKNAPFKSQDSQMNCPKKIRQCNYNKDIYIYILYTHYTILYVSVYIIYMYICDTLIIDTYRISYNMQVRKINNVGLPASSPTHGLISK